MPLRPVRSLLTGLFYCGQRMQGQVDDRAKTLAVVYRILGEKKGPASWQAPLAWLAKLRRTKACAVEAACQRCLNPPRSSSMNGVRGERSLVRRVFGKFLSQLSPALSVRLVITARSVGGD